VAIKNGHIYFSILENQDGSIDCASSNDCDVQEDKDSQWRTHEQPQGDTGTKEDDDFVDMAKVLDETLNSDKYAEELAAQDEAARAAGTKITRQDLANGGAEMMVGNDAVLAAAENGLRRMGGMQGELNKLQAYGEMSRAAFAPHHRAARVSKRQMAFAGAMAGVETVDYEDSEAAGVTCSNGDDSICTKCTFGYRGSGTSRCTKCSEIEECKYPRGNAKGPSCSQVDGGETELKCGECKTGFFGDLCEGCDEMKGCAKVTCETAGASTCLECESGFYLKDDGTCESCETIDHCIDTVCITADDAVCNKCKAGWFAAGPECAELFYDGPTGLWVAMRSNGNLANAGPRGPKALVDK